MPVFRNLEFQFGTVIIWHITESPEELRENITLHPSDEQKFKSCRSPVRQCEFLALRQCLRHYFGHNPEVCYRSSGQPFLHNDYQISFSHTRHYAAIFLSKHLQPGIDLERFRESVKNIAHKYMRAEERQPVPEDNPVKHLTAYWSAKEVIVKIEGDRKLDFRQHIRVEPFLYKNYQTTRAHLLNSGPAKSYQLLFKKYEDFLLTIGWREAEKIGL